MSEKGLRSRLAKIYAATHMKYAREEEAINFLQEVRLPGPLLAVMPREASTFEAARHVLPYLQHFLGGVDNPVMVRTFLHETYKNWIDSRLIGHAFCWTERDLNVLRLLGNKLLNQVAQLGCSVALDLNLEDDLAASYICGLTGARVRMSLGRRKLGQFYNLVLDLPISDDLALTYQTLSRQLHRTFYQESGEFPESLDEY